MKKNRNLIDSFNDAIEGIIYSVRTEKNMKIHMITAILVLIACFFFDLTKNELLIVTITIASVIVTEMINTAIEFAIDTTTNYYHPLAKIAKNVAAGAVFIAAINAVLVGFILFWDKLRFVNFLMLHKIRNANSYMIFIILVIVCIITVVIKAIYGEGTPLKGGMPSGHSAIAFSIATIITLLTNEPIAIILSYLMAIIVAQSRVDSNVHSILEVVFGAIFGVLLTILLFSFLN
ncbi:diacylglycerol kinase [Haloimpatiens sp. FM7315]|uniref:diacylglycerol kinase n=1 Tax=Haloimpatiens sp. FM7315 TaxID=3298609 RepID=UPI0039773E58